MSYCVLCVCLPILMSSSSPLPPVVCRRVHVLLWVFLCVCLPILMSSILLLLIFLGFYAVFVCFVCLCPVFVCFVCLCPVSYVPTLADFSRLSILDFPFGFF